MSQTLLDEINSGSLMKELFKNSPFGKPKGVLPLPDMSQKIAEINAMDLTQVVKILKQTLSELPNESEADKGIVGALNKLKQNSKRKHFNWQLNEYPNNKIVIAEGDSWFEHPLIQDGIDWLQQDYELNTVSLASGADWFANMLSQKQYLKELKTQLKEGRKIGAIVLSAGGNDIVDENLKKVITATPKTDVIPVDLVDYAKREFPEHSKAIIKGWKHLTPEFYKKLSLFFVLYVLLFREIRQEAEKIKKKSVKSIRLLLHGYDFAYPSKDISRGQSSGMGHVYKILSNGKNLYKPMEKMKIKPEDMHPISAALIFEFNNMLSLLHYYNVDENFCHIDFRGLFQEEVWNDELHINSYYAEWIGAAFSYAICSDNNPKTVELRKKKVRKEIETQWDDPLPEI